MHKDHLSTRSDWTPTPSPSQKNNHSSEINAQQPHNRFSATETIFCKTPNALDRQVHKTCLRRLDLPPHALIAHFLDEWLGHTITEERYQEVKVIIHAAGKKTAAPIISKSTMSERAEGGVFVLLHNSLTIFYPAT